MKEFNELIEGYRDVILSERVHNQPEADKAATYMRKLVLKKFCDELRLVRKFKNVEHVDAVARYIARTRNEKTSWQEVYQSYMMYFHNQLDF